MQAYILLVTLIAARTNAILHAILKPVFKVLLYSLLRRINQRTLLLLTQGCLHVFIHLLAFLRVKVLPLPILKSDEATIQTIHFTTIDRPFSVSFFCHWVTLPAYKLLSSISLPTTLQPLLQCLMRDAHRSPKSQHR